MKYREKKAQQIVELLNAYQATNNTNVTFNHIFCYYYARYINECYREFKRFGTLNEFTRAIKHIEEDK